MRNLVLLSALASAGALGIATTPAERERGRLMRAPDHPYQHQDFPSWRYGPNGQARIVNSEDETPSGWVDHPSKVKGHEAGGGQQTATQSANGSISEKEAAKTTTAKSQTATDPAKAAANTGGGVDPSSPGAPAGDVELDAHGHPFDPALHTKTRSKTKGGLWRMKPGVSRPDPAPGYPLDL